MEILDKLATSYPFWVKIAVLVLLFAIAALLLFFRIDSKAGTAEPAAVNQGQEKPIENRKTEIDSIPTRPQKVPDYPPLRITFSDGSKGRVEFSVEMAVIPESAPIILTKFGSRDEAFAALSKVIEAKLRDMFVCYTMHEAQGKREEISRIVYGGVWQIAVEDYGTRIHNILLGEITLD